MFDDFTITNTNGESNNDTTVIPSQVKVMEGIKDEWWDLKGFARGLHQYNELRIPFLRDGLLNSYKRQKNMQSKYPLEGFKIIDIGCGGGIATEGLARLGAEVDGVDASDDLLDVARNHAALDPKVNANIRYINSTIEEFCIKNGEVYDGIMASEVIEHIDNKELFVESCIRSLKPGGSIYFTTFNKTWASWICAIILAEGYLDFIPKGTHEWDMFISPGDLSKILEKYNCKTTLVKGINFDMFNDCKWYWAKNIQIGYVLQAIKFK